MDIGSLAVSVTGILLTFLLVYYAIRTLKLFKVNIAARAWTYISVSAVFFSIGVVLFVVDDIEPMGLVPVGGIMQTIGAFFLVLGLRKNFRFWASKDHFT